MAVLSRHFFDLSAAARLSRSLRQGRPVSEGVRAPASRATASVAQVQEAPAAGLALSAFQRSRVQYAEELWQALLEWIQEGLGAQGVFALDKNGFSIGNIGEVTAAPAEVLMASFTSVAQLLEAYLSSKQPLGELMVSTENESPVTMVAMPWEGDIILFGIHGGKMPSADELEMIRTTVRRELAHFAS